MSFLYSNGRQPAMLVAFQFFVSEQTSPLSTGRRDVTKALTVLISFALFVLFFDWTTRIDLNAENRVNDES